LYAERLRHARRMHPARDGSPARQDLHRLPFGAEAEPDPREAQEAPTQGRLSPAFALRVVFAGTPPFAAHALAALHDAGHDMALVLTQPDRPAGRGLKINSSAVGRCAEERGLTVLKPASLREAAAVDSIARAKPDVMVVAAYGLILPADV